MDEYEVDGFRYRGFGATAAMEDDVEEYDSDDENTSPENIFGL